MLLKKITTLSELVGEIGGLQAAEAKQEGWHFKLILSLKIHCFSA